VTRLLGQASVAAPSKPRTRATRGTRSSDTRIEQQPAFVLHSYPWRETSLILELLTRDYGRMSVVARGAKRPTSQFRGLLSVFSPLSVSWSGRGDIKTLIRVEWLGGLAPLHGDDLLNAFYLNELLVRLLAREDPHESLFMAYANALRDLSRRSLPREQALCGFELDLLREIGVAPPFDQCTDGEPVLAHESYRLDPEHGVIRCRDAAPSDLALSGYAMLALAQRELSPLAIHGGARAALKQLIRYHLRGRPLNTHRILEDLRGVSMSPHDVPLVSEDPFAS
jgi:DNA repair protein RecO (recombination protein O)